MHTRIFYEEYLDFEAQQRYQIILQFYVNFTMNVSPLCFLLNFFIEANGTVQFTGQRAIQSIAVLVMRIKVQPLAIVLI